MIHLFILFSLSLSFAGIEKTFDLTSYNPPSKIMDGVAFPRTSELKYRGAAEVQMDRIKAVGAMLGSTENHMESILFSAIKLLLMKERVSFMASVASPLVAAGFDSKVAALLSANNDEPYSVADAQRLAYKMMEDDLSYKMTNGYFQDHFMDYRSGQHELFPKEIIFTTVYLEVANVYSRFISIYDSPMLDLNYWNRDRNGAWVFTANKWVDKGEFITPILIESTAMKGFLEYLSQVPDYRIYRPLPRELDVSFMKVDVKGEPMVLVFDGQNPADRAQAIVEKDGLFYQAESQFDPQADIPKMLKPDKKPAYLMGVIKLCAKAVECKLNAPFFKNYRKSKRQLDNQTMKKITSMKFDNKSPKIFYYDVAIPSKETVTEDPKAVYAKSADLVATEMKATSYNALLNTIAPVEDGNMLTWDLQKMKLAKNQAIFFTIPESFRKRNLLRVSLTSRQDSADNSTPLKGRFDESPSYSSVQFYALTDETEDLWRYWAGITRFSNPKGSFFGDLIDESKASAQNQDDWSITKGVDSDTPQTLKLSVGAMRIVGVGTDTATLYNLTLVFDK